MSFKAKFEFETESEEQAKEITDFLEEMRDKYRIKMASEEDFPEPKKTENEN